MFPLHHISFVSWFVLLSCSFPCSSFPTFLLFVFRLKLPSLIPSFHFLFPPFKFIYFVKCFVYFSFTYFKCSCLFPSFPLPVFPLHPPTPFVFLCSSFSCSIPSFSSFANLLFPSFFNPFSPTFKKNLLHLFIYSTFFPSFCGYWYFTPSNFHLFSSLCSYSFPSPFAFFSFFLSMSPLHHRLLPFSLYLPFLAVDFLCSVLSVLQQLLMF